MPILPGSMAHPILILDKKSLNQQGDFMLMVLHWNAFARFHSLDEHFSCLSDRINAVQKLHFSWPLNQHASNCTVASMVQWANSFLEFKLRLLVQATIDIC